MTEAILYLMAGFVSAFVLMMPFTLRKIDNIRRPYLELRSAMDRIETLCAHPRNKTVRISEVKRAITPE